MNSKNKTRVGMHTKKLKTFIETLKKYYEDNGYVNTFSRMRPVQLFTGSPKSYHRPVNKEQDIIETRKYIEENRLNVYVHSSYLINLCWDISSFNKKAAFYLKWELDISKKFGFKGVVVHCGKACQLNKDIALNNMYENLINILPHVSESCPLLLETSSGQGTETCHQYLDFKKFYERFTPEQRLKLKICIDTCHVFAAGILPLNFIKKWHHKFPNSIVLIHYNDSKEPFGSKKDRHEIPGEGHIGVETMDNIYDYCYKHDLPMVIE